MGKKKNIKMQQNESYNNKDFRLSELLCVKDVKCGIIGKDSEHSWNNMEAATLPALELS